MSAEITLNLVCKYCHENADGHLALAMAAAFGASVYPPPAFCPTSPNRKHAYEERITRGKPAPAQPAAEEEKKP